MLTIIENLPAAIALSGLLLRRGHTRRELAAMDQRNNVKMNGGREGPSVASANNRAASVAAVLKSGTIAQRSVTFANAQATQNQGSNNSKKR